ncbi:MAG: SOS response-associated peptidase [Gammaproteobacteria bacterium]|nr:SOS response-associated peptidase [Gammaproteobacteria bacterium]
MCGRFAFYSPREAVNAIFGVDFPLDLEPRYNITPSQHVATLRVDRTGVTEPVLLRWGLVPSWAKDPAIGNRMINARAETVREKPSFRAAFKRRRCAILADGFYEWRAVAGAKQPYFITHQEGQPFAMAGLWERWNRGDEPLETCTIITTAANRRLENLHARMPVIFLPEQLEAWLTDDDPEQLQDLLRPCADDLLRYWPVSRRVNSPANEGAELLDEVSG